ncbi:MAG: type II toxin-antitoxin system RelE/ParE family toxin [Candidatus Xenobiia bacterium LiM19]
MSKDEEDKWELIISPKAKKKISVLPPDERAHVTASLDLLIKPPLYTRADVKKMKGQDTGKFRQRIGRWRAILHVDSQTHIIRVIDFGARGDVYKK